jgi:hypothetical protein
MLESVSDGAARVAHTVLEVPEMLDVNGDAGLQSRAAVIGTFQSGERSGEILRFTPRAWPVRVA